MVFGCFRCSVPLVPDEHTELSRDELKRLYDRSVALNGGKLFVHGGSMARRLDAGRRFTVRTNSMNGVQAFSRGPTRATTTSASIPRSECAASREPNCALASLLTCCGSLYLQHILEREVSRFEAEHILPGTALGELDHPNYASKYFKCLNLPNVSHQVLEVTWKGDQLWGTIEVLATPSGLLLWELYSRVCALAAAVSDARDHAAAVRGAAEAVQSFLVASAPALPPLRVTLGLLIPRGATAKALGAGAPLSGSPQLQLFCSPPDHPPAVLPAYQTLLAPPPLRPDALAAVLAGALAAPTSTSASIAASGSSGLSSGGTPVAGALPFGRGSQPAAAQQGAQQGGQQRQVLLVAPEEEAPGAAQRQADLGALVAAGARSPRGSVVLVSRTLPSVLCAAAVYVCAAPPPPPPPAAAGADAGSSAGVGGGGAAAATGAPGSGAQLLESQLKCVLDNVNSVAELLASLLETRLLTGCGPLLAAAASRLSGRAGLHVVNVSGDKAGGLTLSLADTATDCTALASARAGGLSREGAEDLLSAFPNRTTIELPYALCPVAPRSFAPLMLLVDNLLTLGQVTDCLLQISDARARQAVFDVKVRRRRSIASNAVASPAPPAGGSGPVDAVAASVAGAGGARQLETELGRMQSMQANGATGGASAAPQQLESQPLLSQQQQPLSSTPSNGAGALGGDAGIGGLGGSGSFISRLLSGQPGSHVALHLPPRRYMREQQRQHREQRQEQEQAQGQEEEQGQPQGGPPEGGEGGAEGGREAERSDSIDIFGGFCFDLPPAGAAADAAVVAGGGAAAAGAGDEPGSAPRQPGQGLQHAEAGGGGELVAAGAPCAATGASPTLLPPLPPLSRKPPPLLPSIASGQDLADISPAPSARPSLDPYASSARPVPATFPSTAAASASGSPDRPSCPAPAPAPPAAWPSLDRLGGGLASMTSALLVEPVTFPPTEEGYMQQASYVRWYSFQFILVS
ncbi:hypothetical protein TSOC_006044 [Tetrabaena socialis]|uniref:Uncharacterized protein n=1 Tax=Tetrabaena socialis TaxID=47790 RepID=A0A2J8A4Q3_9CHLO|nr:hypothetical protein TSOC_006044 [Tetrabaena socialis]|eukprot:PNH07500.1 hypothetical protein TSOC_006044 [Tetrabaena socialis]